VPTYETQWLEFGDRLTALRDAAARRRRRERKSRVGQVRSLVDSQVTIAAAVTRRPRPPTRASRAEAVGGDAHGGWRGG
jgi:hypothetical protein